MENILNLSSIGGLVIGIIIASFFFKRYINQQKGFLDSLKVGRVYYFSRYYTRQTPNSWGVKCIIVLSRKKLGWDNFGNERHYAYTENGVDAFKEHEEYVAIQEKEGGEILLVLKSSIKKEKVEQKK